jgi:hypothetical protein
MFFWSVSYQNIPISRRIAEIEVSEVRFLRMQLHRMNSLQMPQLGSALEHVAERFFHCQEFIVNSGVFRICKRAP